MSGQRPLKLTPEQVSRLDQWQADRERRTPDGKRIWRCWHCDNLALWGPTHGSFSSIREQEEGIPFIVFCSEECRSFLAIKGLVPRAKVSS